MNKYLNTKLTTPLEVLLRMNQLAVNSMSEKLNQRLLGTTLASGQSGI